MKLYTGRNQSGVLVRSLSNKPTGLCLMWGIFVLKYMKHNLFKQTNIDIIYSNVFTVDEPQLCTFVLAYNQFECVHSNMRFKPIVESRYKLETVQF